MVVTMATLAPGSIGQVNSSSAFNRKKDGGLCSKFWESSETVRSWVGKHYKKYIQVDAPSSKSLAGLVVQLLQFQEDTFGRRATSPALTKLPVSLHFLTPLLLSLLVPVITSSPEHSILIEPYNTLAACFSLTLNSNSMSGSLWVPLSVLYMSISLCGRSFIQQSSHYSVCLKCELYINLFMYLKM